MEELRKIVASNLKSADFDCVATSIIDFSNMKYESIEFSLGDKLYYDLASVSKVMTLGLFHASHRDLFDEELELAINHRAGLPSWGYLSKKSWKQQILSYPIKKSPTLYSDFSALRVMLELEIRHKVDLHESCKKIWDREICFWKNLPEEASSPFTGYRNGQRISRVVHDPNAYTIGTFCSHAGLFATIDGISKTLIEIEKRFSIIDQILREFKDNSALERYILGWDRVIDTKNTVAGSGCSNHTFGHLGFTGTSIWIDADKRRGVVILSNGTREYWYDRTKLDKLRRDIGTFAFTKL